MRAAPGCSAPRRPPCRPTPPPLPLLPPRPSPARPTCGDVEKGWVISLMSLFDSASPLRPHIYLSGGTANAAAAARRLIVRRREVQGPPLRQRLPLPVVAHVDARRHLEHGQQLLLLLLLAPRQLREVQHAEAQLPCFGYVRIKMAVRR